MVSRVSEQVPPTRPLEATARWTAAVRAAESARDDRLFDDPWAERLAGPEGRSWIDERSPDSVVPIALRTRYFDDWLGSISERDGIRQIVLVAAGLDTRAYRLDWPDRTHLFELDRPAVLRHKDEVLAGAGARPRCLRRTVEADLTGSGPIRSSRPGSTGRGPRAGCSKGSSSTFPPRTSHAFSTR